MLEGVRVLDLTRMLAGPFATMLLADLGAEVIKVESPDGDETRRMGPPLVDGQSAYFVAVNRNKKSVTLDLKTPAGRGAFERLARTADVVVDNFRPGVTARLGVDYESLARTNPRIICCSITSFGEDGPLANDPAFDLVIQAYSGAMSLTGEPGRMPVRMGVPMGDLAGGMYAALGVAAALHRRNSTGRGERISVNLLDSLTALLSYVAQYHLADGRVPPAQGSRHMSVVPYGAFAAADAPFVVAVFTERFWGAFCRAVERPDFAEDAGFATNELRARHRDVLEPALEAHFRTRPAAEWIERLRREGVPCAPILTVDRALAGSRLVRGDPPMLGSPFGGAPRSAPRLGEHNGEILGGSAG